VTAATTADAALVHALTQRAWHGTVAANSSAYLETAADIEALFARGGAARAAGVGRLQLGVRRDQPRLVAFWATLGFEADASVALSSHNPLTEPPVTMSRRLGHAAPHRPR
jgi:hypothetical protein